MKPLKIIIKFGALFSALILILFVGFILYLNTSVGQKMITSYTSDILNKTLSLETHIDAVYTNIFSSIDIENLILKSAEDTILYLNKGRINYSLFSLVKGKIKLNDIRVDSLKACVKRDSNGLFQLDVINPDRDKKDDTSSALSIVIDHFTIQKSKLCYDDNSIPLNVTGKNVSATMSLKNGIFKVNANLHSVYFDYFKQPIFADRFIFSTSIASSAIRIDSLELIFPKLAITGRLNIGLDAPLSLNGKFAGKGRLSDLLHAFINRDTLKRYYKNDSTTFKLGVNGNVSDLNVSSIFSKITIFDIPVLKSNLSFNLSKNTLRLKNLDMLLFGGRLAGQGMMRNTSMKNFSFDLKLINIESNRLIPSILLNNFTINGRLQASGSIAEAKNIALTSKLIFRHNKTDKKNFISEIGISNGKGNVYIRRGENNSASLTLKLKENITSGAFYGVVDSIDSFTKLLNLPRVKGALFFKGDFDWPIVNANITAKSLYYRNLSIDTVNVDLSQTDSTTIITRSFFASYDTLVNPYDINNLRAIIRYHGEIHGDINNLSGQFDANLNNLFISQYKIDSVYTQIKYNNHLLFIDRLILNKSNGQMTLIGDINIKLNNANFNLSLKNSIKSITGTLFLTDSLYHLNIIGDSLKIKAIKPFIPDMPLQEGLINAKLLTSFDHNFKKRRIIFDFFAKKPSYHDLTYADSIYMAAQFYKQRLQIDSLQLYLSGEKSTGKMSFSFSDSSDNPFKIAHSEGRLIANNIDLQIFNPFLKKKYHISGRSTHNFSWNGSYSHPNFDGFLIVNNGRIINNDDEALLKDINLSVSVSDTLINIDSIAFKNNSTSMLTKGTLNIKKNKVDIHLNSFIKDRKTLEIAGYTTLDSIYINSKLTGFDLSLINPLISVVEDVKGKVNSRLSISGDIKNPDFRGNFDIDRLSFNQEYLGETVKNGNIAINFDNKTVKIDTFNLPLRKGFFSLSGAIGLDALSIKSFDLKAKLDNIELLEPDMFQLLINTGDFTLLTKKNIHILNGNLIFGDSKFFRDLKIDDLWQLLLSRSENIYMDKKSSDIDLLSFYEEELKTSDIVIPDFLKNMKLDINLENKGDLWVYNNVADFFLTTNLNLSGEIINPSLSGRIKINENGRINFIDRIFEIRKGVFEFVDTEKINPIINLSAETEIDISTGDENEEKTYLIHLLIDGPLDQMNFSLTSQPSMPPSDIISLLTLGMSYNEIASLSGNTQSSDALKKRSGEIAGQIISQKMNSYLKKVLGGDAGDIDFELKGNIFDINDTQIALNKRWGKRVTVSYSTSIKDLDKSVIHIEYKISDVFSIEGETNQNQESAVDFKYRIRFK